MMQIVVVEPGDVIAVMKNGTLIYYIMNDEESKLVGVSPTEAQDYQRKIKQEQERIRAL